MHPSKSRENCCIRKVTRISAFRNSGLRSYFSNAGWDCKPNRLENLSRRPNKPALNAEQCSQPIIRCSNFFWSTHSQCDLVLNLFLSFVFQCDQTIIDVSPQIPWTRRYKPDQAVRNDHPFLSRSQPDAKLRASHHEFLIWLINQLPENLPILCWYSDFMQELSPHCAVVEDWTESLKASSGLGSQQRSPMRCRQSDLAFRKLLLPQAGRNRLQAHAQNRILSQGVLFCQRFN